MQVFKINSTEIHTLFDFSYLYTNLHIHTRYIYIYTYCTNTPKHLLKFLTNTNVQPGLLMLLTELILCASQWFYHLHKGWGREF